MDGPGSMRGWAGAPGRRSAQWRTGPSRGSEASGKTPDGSDSGHLASRRPARSGRLMFSARYTNSPRALSRTLNRRKPGTSSHWAQPLALRVPLPPRWCRQLLDHPVCRRVRVRVAARRLFPLPPRRHIPVDTPRFELRQVPLIAGSTVSGCAVSFTSSSNPVISPWSLAFDVNSVATINRCSPSTATCALQHCRNPSAPVFTMALSGSVKLLLSSGSPQARLYGCPPLRSHSGRRPRLRRNNRRQPVRATAQLLGQLVSTQRPAKARVFLRIGVASLQRFDCLHAAPPCASDRSSSPCACSRSPEPSSRLSTASRNSKAPSRAPGAPPPRTAPRTPPGAGGETRTACGGVPRHPKRHVLLQLPRHPPQHPRRIPVEQHLDHHPRLIRGVATTVTLIRRRPRIQPVHQVAHVMRKVPFRKPIPHIRRQQQLVRRMSSASLPRLLFACCRIIFYGAHSWQPHGQGRRALLRPVRRAERPASPSRSRRAAAKPMRPNTASALIFASIGSVGAPAIEAPRRQAAILCRRQYSIVRAVWAGR